ncbi:carbonic anhydrase 1-like isoform X2 [Dermacentor albipictus]|uniref:carbonic anhydrase 1-like isoform X2 n=1 Tax=Dermacentor albipictus TaxID=60249 RepID=UPI0031FE0F8E
MDRRRLAFVLLWQIVAVQGMVRERWHYYAPKCHVPGPQPIVPREWGQEWSSCNGAKQSPVLLLPHKSIGVAVPPLIFKHFSTPLANPVVYNTGRTLRVRASMPKPIVTGGLLAEEYVFDQAEFHWGRDDHSGSEHIVDALSYAVEVQMTFRLRTPSARVDCRECPPAYVGLATQLKTVRQRNPLLRTLIASLSSVTYALERTDLPLPLRLIAFMPNDTRNYYMYEGSRTVPPCTENVLWIVFREPTFIGREQVKMLRQLYAFPEVIYCNRHLVANLRPLQEIGRTRMLYRTFSSAPSRLRLSFTTTLAFTLLSCRNIIWRLKECH